MSETHGDWGSLLNSFWNGLSREEDEADAWKVEFSSRRQERKSLVVFVHIFPWFSMMDGCSICSI